MPSMQCYILPFFTACTCAVADGVGICYVRGMLGLKLSDLVSGRMRWVFISNYMVDLQWLLSAAPDLADADKLIIAHGWRRPVRWKSAPMHARHVRDHALLFTCRNTSCTSTHVCGARVQRGKVETPS